MTEAEFLERFDRHLARMDAYIEVSNQHMARGNALMEEVRHEMALTRSEVQRSRESHEDLRAFTRDTTRRNEKVWREAMAGLADFRKGVREDLGDMRGSLADMRDAIRADTAAILRLLDRFGNGGATA